MRVSEFRKWLPYNCKMPDGESFSIVTLIRYEKQIASVCMLYDCNVDKEFEKDGLERIVKLFEGQDNQLPLKLYQQFCKENPPVLID